MKHYSDEMPLYVAVQLNQTEVAALEAHLASCPECQDALRFWRAVSHEIVKEDIEVSAPAGLAEGALKQIHADEDASPLALSRFKIAILSVFSLLRAQAYLVKREIWPASAGILALSVILALISNHVEAISFSIPLVAAASLAALYGPANDPAYELTLATPTSTWKILLARLSVVSAFNLGLAMLASLIMLLIVPPDQLVMIVMSWLATMAFLSTLALLLSLWLSTGAAIFISYGLWVFQYLNISAAFKSMPPTAQLEGLLVSYRHFWQSPGLMIGLSLILLVIALLSTRFTDHGLNQPLA